MNTFHGFSICISSLKQKVNVDFADHQNTVIRFDLACDFGTQPTVACIYFARFQRAPEGPDHSTTQSGYDVIKGCRVRFDEL